MPSSDLLGVPVPLSQDLDQPFTNNDNIINKRRHKASPREVLEGSRAKYHQIDSLPLALAGWLAPQHKLILIEEYKFNLVDQIRLQNCSVIPIWTSSICWIKSPRVWKTTPHRSNLHTLMKKTAMFSWIHLSDELLSNYSDLRTCVLHPYYYYIKMFNNFQI